MSELLPTSQARDLQHGLVDFLRTTFALADADAQVALEDFLRHDTEGIFKGAYVRLRLPFRPAEPGWERHLAWTPAGFVPYGHQADAFARLTSRPDPGSGDRFRRPRPTLVTTGTGSGKTEAFLYPVLDHVLRAREAGVTGTKALILYPMNALATDQAGRLAALLTGDSRLAGVTAALYTGDSGAPRTRVGKDGLITARYVIRDDPPDILLTNYKMLDQLLLRNEDQPLWRRSARSLTYLVLDEFHTYDGAQGTDVAMLLRRLALALADARGDEPADDPAAAEPLAGLVPVATSATLGDSGDPGAMIDFAGTVFGVPFDKSCVITESRLSADEWAGEAAERVASAGLKPVVLAGSSVAQLNADLDRAGGPDGETLTRTALDQLFEPSPPSEVPAAGVPVTDLVRAHPQLRTLAGVGSPRDLDGLAEVLLRPGEDAEQARLLVANLVAVLSHVRSRHGRGEVSVETHLWVRELCRIDRDAATLPRYRWSDDGPLSLLDATETGHRPAFPAIYCRHCGRSGWGVELAPTGLGLAADDRDIRGHHAAGEGRFRALIHAPQEAAADPSAEGLAWLDVRARELATRAPAEDAEDLREGWLLPVLALLGRPEEDSRNDRCPACDQPDGIRFLGSSIATLLSVSLSTLFGSAHLDQREKKALVFTDSVQDAAHRAGFVESRSHTLTLRAATRGALDARAVSVDRLAEEMIRRAGDDRFARYRLLAPELIGRERFDPFWRVDPVPNAALQAVRRRLLFDLVCEFGVHSRIGRTLEATGSVVAEVDAGAVSLAAVGRAVLAQTEHQAALQHDTSDRAVTAWVRGTLEHLRTQGAVHHEWLGPYLAEDGSRYRIWGGRARDQGMPAFPTRRTAPAFPRVGPRLERAAEVLLDSVTSPQSWYARWAARVLGVPAGHGARLARGLLERLHRADLLTSHTTRSQATVYALTPDR
ncbi:MAG TPA: DEAD/DEAH box helicase, partial [Candidatus Nanopelagicales bacterium]|nr:DEAD/DEAH box helicase [Candidatus Nanopelagicales bacterium]